MGDVDEVLVRVRRDLVDAEISVALGERGILVLRRRVDGDFGQLLALFGVALYMCV